MIDWFVNVFLVRILGLEDPTIYPNPLQYLGIFLVCWAWAEPVAFASWIFMLLLTKVLIFG
jgi:hypothetical protein